MTEQEELDAHILKTFHKICPEVEDGKLAVWANFCTLNDIADATGDDIDVVKESTKRLYMNGKLYRTKGNLYRPA